MTTSVNATPFVGVLFLEWSLAALLLIYWFELGIDLVFASLRSLFAQRPPEVERDGLLIGAVQHKRGGVDVPGTGLTIQIANIPFSLGAVLVFGFIWFFVGVLAIGGVGQALVENPIDRNATVTFLLGVGGVLVGRGYETITEYFLDEVYQSVSAQRALQSAIFPILVVGTAMAVGGLAVAGGLPPAVALGLTLTGKLVFDLVDVFRDRLVAFDGRNRLDLGFASEPDEWPAVETGVRPPVDVVRPNNVALVIGGIARGLWIPALWIMVILIGGLAVLALADGEPNGGVVFGLALGALVTVFAGVGVLDRAVRHGAMEYRVGRDVVGYDRLFDEPQWRLPRWKLERAEPTRTVVDRLVGTCTVVVTHEGRDIRLAHVTPEAIESVDADTG